MVAQTEAEEEKNKLKSDLWIKWSVLNSANEKIMKILFLLVED